MAEHNFTGATGEILAQQFLEDKGFRILEMNYRYGRHEVDIIAAFEGILHFVEVKTKAGGSPGLPEQRVNTDKINRMKRVAEQYLYLHPQWKMIQFDIISVTMQHGRPPAFFMVEDIW